MNILIVEDNTDNAKVLVYRLRRIGDFAISQATDGREALAIWAKEIPDLIFMDLRMPVMDGFEATKRIRSMEQGRRVPIIALTALALAGDRERALAAGCDDYIAKPVLDPKIIQKKVEQFFSLGRGERWETSDRG